MIIDVLWVINLNIRLLSGIKEPPGYVLLPIHKANSQLYNTHNYSTPCFELITTLQIPYSYFNTPEPPEFERVRHFDMLEIPRNTLKSMYDIVFTHTAV